MAELLAGILLWVAGEKIPCRAELPMQLARDGRVPHISPRRMRDRAFKILRRFNAYVRLTSHDSLMGSSLPGARSGRGLRCASSAEHAQRR